MQVGIISHSKSDRMIRKRAEMMGVQRCYVGQVAKLANTPGYYIVPGVILFVFMGAWLSTTSVGDWILCITFGVIGYVMKRAGWARPPVVLGYVLGVLEPAEQEALEARHQDAVGSAGGAVPVGREPAEGRPVQVARHRAERADAAGSGIGESGNRITVSHDLR